MADKWRVIESEMNRFEEEISSLGSNTAGNSTLPATTGGGLSKPALFIPASVVRRQATANSSVRPTATSTSTPVVISGAPQVYNSVAVLSKGPVKNVVSSPSMSASSSTLLQPQSVQVPISRQVRPSLIPGAPKITTMVGTRLLPTPSVATSSLEFPNADMKQENFGDAAASTRKPETSASVKSNNASKKKKKKKAEESGGGPAPEKKPKKHLRSAGGTVWEDPTLLDWDPSDFRLFCGDLGNDVTDEVLARVFARYASFQQAKVVRDKRTNKTRGYGFVSFKDANDFVRAIRELDGLYVGSRPIKLRKSTWKSRGLNQVRKREKELKQLMGPKKQLF